MVIVAPRILSHALMLKGTGIALGTTLLVAVAALIVGKAFMLADLLLIINRIRTGP